MDRELAAMLVVIGLGWVVLASVAWWVIEQFQERGAFAIGLVIAATAFYFLVRHFFVRAFFWALRRRPELPRGEVNHG